jgi:hypothetical protein
MQYPYNIYVLKHKVIRDYQKLEETFLSNCFGRLMCHKTCVKKDKSSICPVTGVTGQRGRQANTQGPLLLNF